MGDYDESGSDDYSAHYDDDDSGGNQEHHIQRKKKNPFDLAGAASGDGDDCCAHVVSPYVFLATLVGLAIATYFIRQAITMNLGKRKKRSLTGGAVSRIPMLLVAGKLDEMLRN